MSSHTSYGSELRAPSPTPSVWSMTSSMREAIFRQEYGRNLNNYSEVYRLPADEEELDRLNKQHEMFKEMMGRYPPPMEEVMAEDDSPGEERKAVLDLGCGSGCWQVAHGPKRITDVALDFPHCSAVAVDLVPMQSLTMPPNLRRELMLEVDDINLGLEHFYNDFNVVHVRLISSGIRDYAGLVDQITRVLRPGGMLDLLEFDFRVYGGDRKPIIVRPSVMEGPWLPRWMYMCQMAVRQRGGHVDAANLLRRWVSDHRCMEDVVYREFWAQTAPWNPGKDAHSMWLNEMGAIMRDDIKAFLRSGRPLLLGSGLPQEFVDDLEARAVKELDEGRTPTLIRLENVYARKRR
ncbi:hypothetical protein JAAARDRAFT_694199 [Jaapia argillacea MUCL 33604]|uniref:Methyltransferase domain-containing protein n=1 Tax=Jaapia argillacea MUCL 33604 TaxID=933084 RepID=A0A067Q7N9_9AGAM|nr:hypothetical protein JAAARDRAFT_694199 [Jaapia argillacea MUCL 33604]